MNLEDVEQIVSKIESSKGMAILNYLLGILIVIAIIGFVWKYVLGM